MIAGVSAALVGALGWLRRNPASTGTALFAIGLGAILLTAYCSGANQTRAKQATEQARVVQRGAAASERAAKARVRAALDLERQRKELEDARNSDGVDPDIAHSCAIMRQQGFNTSAIPACR